MLRDKFIITVLDHFYIYAWSHQFRLIYRERQVES